MCGWHTSNIMSSHLDEFLYRQFAGNAGMEVMEHLLGHLTIWYPSGPLVGYVFLLLSDPLFTFRRSSQGGGIA